MSILLKDGIKYLPYDYNEDEDVLEDMVFEHYRDIFGEKALLFRKKRIENILGKKFSIPDGFILDCEKNRFFIIEVERAAHGVKHIHDQVTGFEIDECKDKLIVLFEDEINEDNFLKKIIEEAGIDNTFKYLTELFKKDKDFKTIIIIDEKIIKKEKSRTIDLLEKAFKKQRIIPELIEFKTYIREGTKSVHIHQFEPIFSTEKITKKEPTIIKKKSEITEEYHFKKVSEEIKQVYKTIKNKMLAYSKDLIFNPTKYYISIREKEGKNFAIIQFRKKKIIIVLNLPEDIARQNTKYYEIKSLSKSVQKYYGWKCCEIIVEDKKHLNEIYRLLKMSKSNITN